MSKIGLTTVDKFGFGAFFVRELSISVAIWLDSSDSSDLINVNSGASQRFLPSGSSNLDERFSKIDWS